MLFFFPVQNRFLRLQLYDLVQQNITVENKGNKATHKRNQIVSFRLLIILISFIFIKKILQASKDNINRDADHKNNKIELHSLRKTDCFCQKED